MTDATNAIRAIIDIVEAADREAGEPMVSSLPILPGLVADWKLPIPIRLLRALQREHKNSGAAVRWRHLKRGSTYVEIGPARIQSEVPLLDGDRVQIYRSEHDGSLWSRRLIEFHDGRFERLPALPTETLK